MSNPAIDDFAWPADTSVDAKVAARAIMRSARHLAGLGHAALAIRATGHALAGAGDAVGPLAAAKDQAAAAMLAAFPGADGALLLDLARIAGRVTAIAMALDQGASHAATVSRLHAAAAAIDALATRVMAVRKPAR